jgi:hypothetical protein
MSNKSNNWIGAAAGAATGLISMLGQRKREKRALKNQKDLMGLQFRNQQALNKQGHQLQLDMWKKTNYPAQMKMLREAGLNPGLLYGQSGGGGTTAGSQGGGSAASGNAPAPQPMELGTALTAAQTASAIELQKAQSRKLRADARNQELDNVTKERFGQSADIVEAQNRHQKGLQEGQYLYNTISKGTFGKEHTQHSNYTKMLENEFVLQSVEARIREETEHERKQQAAYNTMNMALDARLKEANIDLTREQERKIWHDIWQGWTNSGFNGLSKIINGVLLKNGIKIR